MTEEDIKRIEKKVDLLYKILLELNVGDIGHPYNQEYINKFMNEIIPLFKLSAEEVDIEKSSTPKEINELKSGLETELSRLKKVYESGDFLAKDEVKIKNKIEGITDYLECWDDTWDSSGVVAGMFKNREEIMNKNKQIYERTLFVDLKRKLGLDVGDAYISYETDYSGELKRISLIEKRNAFKKNLKDTIEKIRNLGKPNN